MSAARRLLTPRLLLVAGIGVGLLSWRETVGHVGDPDFLVDRYPLGASHAWYHAFREACGDVAKMAVFLLTFFGPSGWRTPITWWIVLILMLGYYAPFWIGEPFLPALSAQNLPAQIIHLVMAALAFAALILARPSFVTLPEARK
ncbi:hypothetical protein NF552_00140 [Roseomonas mucosa]|nr:hypothetical protein NF552_00140 [Roseomonas mucosa]